MARATRDKVLEKVAQYWPDVDPEEIMSVLDEYGAAVHFTAFRDCKAIHYRAGRLAVSEQERAPAGPAVDSRG